jgi:hypothetical protein
LRYRVALSRTSARRRLPEPGSQIYIKPAPGVMKMRDKEEQLTVLAEQIFVPAGADESGEIRGVEEGSETVYSSVERVRREAAPYGSSEREDLPESATQTGQIL